MSSTEGEFCLHHCDLSEWQSHHLDQMKSAAVVRFQKVQVVLDNLAAKLGPCFGQSRDQDTHA